MWPCFIGSGLDFRGSINIQATTALVNNCAVQLIRFMLFNQSVSEVSESVAPTGVISLFRY